MSLTTSCSPPADGTHSTMYSRTFPSAGSQRTFRVVVVGSVTFRFLTNPSGSEQEDVFRSFGFGYSVLTSARRLLTRLPVVGQAGSVSLGVDGHNCDAVARVW